MNNGYTVEPAIVIDPATGEETLDYSQANIHDHSVRMAGINEHNHEQDNYFYDDPASGVRNLFSETQLSEGDEPRGNNMRTWN